MDNKDQGIDNNSVQSNNNDFVQNNTENNVIENNSEGNSFQGNIVVEEKMSFFKKHKKALIISGSIIGVIIIALIIVQSIIFSNPKYRIAAGINNLKHSLVKGFDYSTGNLKLGTMYDTYAKNGNLYFRLSDNNTYGEYIIDTTDKKIELKGSLRDDKDIDLILDKDVLYLNPQYNDEDDEYYQMNINSAANAVGSNFGLNTNFNVQIFNGPNTIDDIMSYYYFGEGDDKGLLNANVKEVPLDDHFEEGVDLEGADMPRGLKQYVINTKDMKKRTLKLINKILKMKFGTTAFDPLEYLDIDSDEFILNGECGIVLDKGNNIRCIYTEDEENIYQILILGKGKNISSIVLQNMDKENGDMYHLGSLSFEKNQIIIDDHGRSNTIDFVNEGGGTITASTSNNNGEVLSKFTFYDVKPGKEFSLKEEATVGNDYDENGISGNLTISVDHYKVKTPKNYKETKSFDIPNLVLNLLY